MRASRARRAAPTSAPGVPTDAARSSRRAPRGKAQEERRRRARRMSTWMQARGHQPGDRDLRTLPGNSRRARPRSSGAALCHTHAKRVGSLRAAQAKRPVWQAGEMNMSWVVAVLGFACAIELVLIVALDRYAHGLARRLDQLEQSTRKPAPLPHGLSERRHGVLE